MLQRRLNSVQFKCFNNIDAISCVTAIGTPKNKQTNKQKNKPATQAKN